MRRLPTEARAPLPRRGLGLVVVAFAGLAAALVTSRATPQQRPAFGASVDLVLIDLIASGRDGRPVTDLRADEIQVFEEGKPQRLEFVRFVAAREGAPAVMPGVVSPAPPEPSGHRPSPEAPGTAGGAPPALVVVVDLYTTPADALVLARQAIVSMAREQVDPGTRLMLVALDRGVQIRQPFTDDLAAFVAAVEALKPSAGNSEATFASFVEDVNRSCDGTSGGPSNALSLARVYLANAKQGTTVAMEGLAALARYLAPLAGRKQVAFYSAGYSMRPAATVTEIVDGACGGGRAGLGMSQTYTSLSGTQVDSTRLLRAVLDEANRAQVSVYTVDARGLGGPGAEAVPSATSAVTTRMVSQGVLQSVQGRALREPQEILRTLADQTGAVASVNSNDLRRGMQAAMTDSRGYYLLAYAPPPGRKAGRFYRIELKVARPGLSLRYRKGYEWLSDVQRAERSIDQAALFPGLFAEDGLAVEARVEAGEVKVVALLPTKALVFREVDGQRFGEVELQALLRDAGGRPVGKRYFFARSVAMKLSPGRHAELLARDDLEIAASVLAPRKKGGYHLTVVVRHSGGRLAAATTTFDVP
ncbi:MAG: VWA domain-containing protein [Vicinamibacteria bacterium]